eukprot:scaffold451_cov365-Prasinococcus_capsulatus_cf.AAC.35
MGRGGCDVSGGSTRMTLSITLLVMETTGALQLIVPLMLVIFVAKVVGDMFTPGIYDLHIKLKGAPLLEEFGLNGHHKMKAERLKVSDVMAESMVVLPAQVSVRKVISTLRESSHAAFPVLSVDELKRYNAVMNSGSPTRIDRVELDTSTSNTEEQGSRNGGSFDSVECQGIVLKEQLFKMLEHRIGFISDPADAFVLPHSHEKILDMKDKLEPRADGPVKPIEVIAANMSEEDLNKFLDLGEQHHPCWCLTR